MYERKSCSCCSKKEHLEMTFVLKTVLIKLFSSFVKKTFVLFLSYFISQQGKAENGIHFKGNKTYNIK